jgi:ribosomal protein L7/L12
MNLERLEDQVRALIDRNQKVEAIKLVLGATGWGLRESKDYVDTLARAALPALSPADETTLKQEVRALIQQDRYAEAVKHVRERTG